MSIDEVPPQAGERYRVQLGVSEFFQMQRATTTADLDVLAMAVAQRHNQELADGDRYGFVFDWLIVLNPTEPTE